MPPTDNNANSRYLAVATDKLLVAEPASPVDMDLDKCSAEIVAA